MKNKSKKFGSLNSILILLQQLQVKYFDSHTFYLQKSKGGYSVTVFVSKDETSEMFTFYEYDDSETFESTYQDLLLYLKKIDNEEQK